MASAVNKIKSFIHSVNRDNNNNINNINNIISCDYKYMCNTMKYIFRVLTTAHSPTSILSYHSLLLTVLDFLNIVFEQLYMPGFLYKILFFFLFQENT